jgi:CelD/BcsL family acetyltransferase involved in cellulose biosynthesis
LNAERVEARDEIADLIRLAEPWALAHPLGIQMESWWLLPYLGTIARRPLAIALRDGNDLLALGFLERRRASLALRGLARKRVLVFLSQGPSDFSDLLLAPGVKPDEVVAAFAEALRNIPGIDELALEQFPESSRVAGGLSTALGAPLQDWVRVYSADLSAGYEALWRGTGRNARRDIHKKERKLRELLEIRHEMLTHLDDALVSKIISLNQRRGERRSPFLGRGADFTLRMIHECQAAGRLLVFAMMAGDSLVSYRLGFLRDGVFYDWNTSYDPDLFELSPGKIHLAHILKYAVDQGFREFNFMRGDEDYKRIWSTGHTTNRALVLPLPTMRMRLAGAWARRSKG